MKLIWYGNAAVWLCGETGAPVLFDPYLGLPGAEHRPEKALLRAVEHVFVTHGHPDHIGSLKKLYGAPSCSTRIYCTPAPAAALSRQGLRNVTILTPERDVFSFGDMTVTPLESAHVCADWPLILATALSPHILRYCYNLPCLGLQALTQREKGETVAYWVESGGRTLLLLGSLNLRADRDYPRGMDVLVLPSQGRRDLAAAVLEIVGRLRPKTVLLDHFDDAFPPISHSIDAQSVCRAIQQAFPGIRVILPPYGQTMELP